MKNLFLVLFVTLLTTASFGQKPRDYKATKLGIVAGTTMNLNRVHYKTTLDWNGIQSVFEGTAHNVITATEQGVDEITEVVNNVGSTIGGLFGNNSSSSSSNGDSEQVVENDNVTYYKYDDAVLKQEKVVERLLAPTVGVYYELRPWSESITAGVQATMGKYKTVGIDICGYAQVRPVVIFGKARELVTGYELDDNPLNGFFLSFRGGTDTSYPGLPFFSKKYYVGSGVGYTLHFLNRRGSINLAYFLDMTGREKTSLRQTSLSLTGKFDLK